MRLDRLGLFCGVAVSAISSFSIYKSSNCLIQSRLHGYTNEVSNQFYSELNLQLKDTYVSNFVRYLNNNLTYDRFHDITSPALNFTRGTTAIGYLAPVRRSDRDDFEEMGRKEYPDLDPPFQITKFTTPPVTTRMDDVDLCYVFLYSTPLLTLFVGFDFNSFWESTINKALTRKQPVLSPGIKYLEDLGVIPPYVGEDGLTVSGNVQDATFTVYYPVTIDGAVDGFIVKDLRVTGVLDSIVHSLGGYDGNVALSMHEVDDLKPGETRMIYHRPDPGEITIADAMNQGRLRSTRTLHIDGKFLTFVSTTDDSPDTRVYAGVGLSGVVFSVVVWIMYRNTLRKSVENMILARKYETASQTKSKFLAHMSHELRTPLNGVLGVSEILSDIATGETREYITTINSCGNILLRVIGNILDFSKIEADELTYEYAPYDVRKHLVETMFTLLAVYKKPETAGLVKLTYHIEDNVPGGLVVGNDSSRVQQVLLNLVSNAFKFTDKGTISVNVSCSPVTTGDVPRFMIANAAEEDGDKANAAEYRMIRYEVTDSGIGISKEKVRDLFKSYSQIHTGRNVGGTGLGLVICKSICEYMGGTVTVSSVTGEGTTFSATVMARVETKEKHAVLYPDKNTWVLGRHVQMDTISPTRVDSVIDSIDVGPGPSTRPVVLVADDNPVNVKILQKTLEKIGAEVHVAKNGLVALEMCRTTEFSILMLDYHMPEMNGIDAIRRIRKEGVNRDTPCFCVTASSTREDKELILVSGAQECILKPIKRETIFARSIEYCSAEEKRWIKDSYSNLYKLTDRTEKKLL